VFKTIGFQLNQWYSCFRLYTENEGWVGSSWSEYESCKIISNRQNRNIHWKWGRCLYQ